jgi:hypothetical protein
VKIAPTAALPPAPPTIPSTGATTEATRAKQANPAKQAKAADPAAKGAAFGHAVAEFAHARNEARRVAKRGETPPVQAPPTTTTPEPTVQTPPAAGDVVDVTV